MILFLNFAPIEFKGGAERWTKDVSEELARNEETYLLSVHPSISDAYGKIVINRRFSENFEKIEFKNVKYISLKPEFFIPFSSKFYEIYNLFKAARIVYIKFEFLEIFISLYFGGFNILKKSVGGIHSPLKYPQPQSFFNRLHNIIYTSFVYDFFLSQCFKIHVLNKRDEGFLHKKFNAKNVSQIYDGVNIANKFSGNNSSNKKELNIITVGELSLRKGTDILSKIIEKAPNNFNFSVVGDGPLRDLIKNLALQKKCKYYGYIDNEKELRKIYAKNDILLFPSRAETLGLVMPEAMSCGLKVINSKEVKLSMPSYAEISSNSEDPDEYIVLLQKVFQEKQQNKISKHKLHKYAYENFSNEKIYPVFFKEILGINRK